MISAVLSLYSLALIAALVGGLPYWLFRMATAAKYREGLTQRLGAVPERLRVPGAKVDTIWVHAVSVGEVTAVVELVKRLRAEGYRVVVSTTTRTGQRLARGRFGAESVFYFPLDLAWIVRRYLRVLRPRMLVLVETEFWPNVLTECRRAGVKVAVVNARISDRSYPRYLRLQRLWKPLLGGVSVLLAQSELDVERLKAIGAPVERVRLCGNLKFDVRPPAAAPVTTALQRHLPAAMRLLVCGSTVSGEEPLLLEAWASLVSKTGQARGACMVLAPRHPERFASVGKLLDHSGLLWVRRSEWMRAPESLLPGSIVLLNSIGELASVYSLASVAFVGGSLVPMGGHNPLEPAQCGVPVVMGPYFHNFRTVVKRLLAEDAIRIVGAANAPVSASDLSRVLGDLLADSDAAGALGSRALSVFQSESGATARTLKALIALVRGNGSLPQARTPNTVLASGSSAGQSSIEPAEQPAKERIADGIKEQGKIAEQIHERVKGHVEGPMEV